MNHRWKTTAALLLAVAAAGSAATAAPPWARKEAPPRGPDYVERERGDALGYGRPTLAGVAIRAWDRGRALEVRSGDDVYRVDASRAEVRGARPGRIREGSRVLVWGRFTDRRTVRAVRIQVLGGDGEGWQRPGGGPWQHPRPTYGGDYAEDVLVGQVTRRSSPMSTRNIRVAARGEEWFVEVPKDARVIRDGQPISIHDVREGEWVRVQGERVGDAYHIRADAIRVGDAPDTRPWSSSGPRWNDGASYEGTVRDVAPDEGTFRLRLNRFETCTVQVGGDVRVTRNGRRASLRDLREGSRVRVYGRLDGRARTLEARAIEIL